MSPNSFIVPYIFADIDGVTGRYIEEYTESDYAFNTNTVYCKLNVMMFTKNTLEDTCLK